MCFGVGMSHSPPTDLDESSFRVWVNTPGDFDATSFLEFTLDSISFVLGTAQLASTASDGSDNCGWPDRGWRNRGEYERELRAGLEQRGAEVVVGVGKGRPRGHRRA